MSKYSSDSNSRDRNRSYSRYNKRRHRSRSSSSLSSKDDSRSSRKNYSNNRSSKKSKKKSKSRYRSDSSSDYSSSRHKQSSYSRKRDDKRSNKHRRSISSSSSSSSSSSHSSEKYSYIKNSNPNEKSKKSCGINSNTCEEVDINSQSVNKLQQDVDWLQNNIYDVVKRENSIEQINQEGFVFKVFKPHSEQKKEEENMQDIPKIPEEIINNLPIEKSTFLISNRDRLLHSKYKLLTKQERSNNWAKYLFSNFKHVEHNGSYKQQ